jgi:hypothetical protein
MAIQKALASFSVIDDTGVAASIDIPFKFDDATATLANLTAWMSGLASAVDDVTEAQLLKSRMTLILTLPGGIKASPVAGSDVEETGLFTWNVSGSSNAYGEDYAAFIQSAFVGKTINQADASVAALIAYLNVASNTIIGTDRYQNALTTVKRAEKTFRKHRRALKRA